MYREMGNAIDSFSFVNPMDDDSERLYARYCDKSSIEPTGCEKRGQKRKGQEEERGKQVDGEEHQ